MDHDEYAKNLSVYNKLRENLIKAEASVKALKVAEYNQLSEGQQKDYLYKMASVLDNLILNIEEQIHWHEQANRLVTEAKENAKKRGTK